MSEAPKPEQQPPPTDAQPAASDLHEYLIGGAILRLRDDYEKLWEEMKAKLREGLQLSPIFKVLWTRTAVHFQFHGKEIAELKARLEKIEATLKKSERRGAK